jgi:hypothetical protein
MDEGHQAVAAWQLRGGDRQRSQRMAQHMGSRDSGGRYRTFGDPIGIAARFGPAGRPCGVDFGRMTRLYPRSTSALLRERAPASAANDIGVEP